MYLGQDGEVASIAQQYLRPFEYVFAGVSSFNCHRSLVSRVATIVNIYLRELNQYAPFHLMYMICIRMQVRIGSMSWSTLTDRRGFCLQD